MSEAWPLISSLLGVIYTLAWSFSFYPQLILNYRRQAVTGFSMDFAHLNVLGFICYTTYTIAFLCSTYVQKEYDQRNPGSDPLVRWNDAVFAGHALLLSSLTLIQTYLPSYKKENAQVVSMWARFILIGSITATIVGGILASANKLMWIDVVYLMSYIKLLVSFLKYLPQLYLNWRRQSTRGWSIFNIALDFTGGALSLLQLIIDCAVVNDFTAITGNIAKTGLSVVSLSFDVLFIIQHYYLYRHSGQADEETTINTAAASENDRLLSASNTR